MVTFLGSLVQLCCGEGGTLQTNIADLCGECSQCMDHTGFAPAQGSVCFPGLHCSGSRLLCRALFKAGPAFRVLPRSKLLRFSDTPQGYRLGWACILCPSQVHTAQMTRCLASTLSQLGGASYYPHSPSPSVSWVHCENTISGMPCVSPGELFSDCNPPGGCQPSRITGRLC